MSAAGRCALLVLSLLLPSVARAQPAPRVHLTITRPISSMCPSTRTLEEDLEQLEDRPIFTNAADADVMVEGEIEDDERGVRVHLAARRADGSPLGTRDLNAPAGQCASLRRSLGLVLSMLIDDEASSERRGVRGLLGADVALLTGGLPRITPGFGVLFGLSLRDNLQLRGEAHEWLPVRVETANGQGAKLQAFAFGLALCPRVSDARRHFQVWLCGGAQLGALMVAPHALTGPAHQLRLFAQALLELKLSVPLGTRSRIEAGAGPYAALAHPRVYYAHGPNQTVDLFRPAALGAIVRLGFVIGDL